MARKPEWRRVKVHRSYTVKEAAVLLGVCKASVRRWINHKGLPVIDEIRPALILGRDLKAYGEAQRQPKQTCKLTECFCMSCQRPRLIAFGEAEIVAASPASANVRALCATCSTVMHRHYGWPKLHAFAALLNLTAPRALRNLIEAFQPCLNVNFEKDE